MKLRQHPRVTECGIAGDPLAEPSVAIADSPAHIDRPGEVNRRIVTWLTA